MFSTLNEKNNRKSRFCFFNDGKQQKARELDRITRGGGGGGGGGGGDGGGDNYKDIS